ncbi:TetR family transcriptional regulator [Lentzea aerocolonigenes]|uniref:TetR family transcriptional regulator n=1 Tax=Lentzea aerocolonigenes TaxID=68170 RepID=A0A0F0GR74_LENAE|nr:TetR/AcrR family transcriptional regulator [Lentzea aerocolonigenes]KJK45091.1 TetR family transcriptional regulator [Lentzea aerocolonigenes]
MGRSSRADAALHREQIVTATAQLLRERGSAGISVQDVMGAAGLSHGGFYKHFASKDELLGIATEAAFGSVLAQLADLTGREDAWEAFVGQYLAPEHRDSPGTGCANTALATESARAGDDAPLRTAYEAGLKRMIEFLVALEGLPDDQEAARRRALVDLATLVGALTMARATGRTPLSREILETVRDELASRR